MYHQTGARVDKLNSGHAGQGCGGQHRARRDVRCQSSPQAGPQLVFNGNAGFLDHLLAGVNDDGLTYQQGGRRQGPGLDCLDPQGDQRRPGLMQGDGVHLSALLQGTVTAAG